MTEKKQNKAKGAFVLGIVSLIGALITFCIRLYLNYELSNIKNDKSVMIVKSGSKKMSRKEFISITSDAISKCTAAAIVLFVVAVIFIALYIVKNKKNKS